jgi:hypothetical protein
VARKLDPHRHPAGATRRRAAGLLEQFPASSRIQYLRGIAAYRRRDYRQAAERFEEAEHLHRLEALELSTWRKTRTDSPINRPCPACT